jgi:uncharacterized protein DUF6289
MRGPTAAKITKDASMIGKFARAGIAALMLGSSVLTVGALPAQAQARPGQIADEVEFIYYSSAAKTTAVGEKMYGACGFSSWGVSSNYYVLFTYPCS